MDAEANGQVGGLDVSEEGRREYARRSRGWVCDVCGESNESVMRGWGEECRERGKGEVDTDEGEKEGEAKSNKEGGEEEPVELPATPTPAATSTTSAPTPPDPPIPDTPVAPPVQQIHRPTGSVAGAAAPSRPARGQSSDGPWLDRAIIGVLVALVVMILRRIVSIDE